MQRTTAKPGASPVQAPHSPSEKPAMPEQRGRRAARQAAWAEGCSPVEYVADDDDKSDDWIDVGMLMLMLRATFDVDDVEHD